MDIQQQLQVIINDSNLSQTEKIDQVLEQGLDFLGLAIGIVSHIDDDIYTVQHARSPGDMIDIGATFAVGNTYCCHTLLANRAVGFHHAKQSAIATHPCYTHFGLESYLGAPIFNDNDVIGTVNFSAAAHRDPFTPSEFEFIEAFANWLSQPSQSESLGRHQRIS